MSELQYLETDQGRRIAYRLTAGKKPTIVFLGGLKSDMEGTKAVHLEESALESGHGFLRFDYSGHGTSSGTFEEGCIGDWHQDTIAAITKLTEGQIILVGSSMGGWQALLFARTHPERIMGLVTIAAAPDFTEDGWWAEFDDAQKALLEKNGQVALPSDYMEPYIVTKRMIEDGRNHLVLRTPLPLPFPTRFLQGTEDSAVSVATANQLLAHTTGADIQLTLVKGADHRFSDGPCLGMIDAAIEDVIVK